MKRFGQTEQFIHNALIDLMHVHSFQSITVTMIAKRAQINRKTFYSHYSSKEDLFCVVMQTIFYDLFSCFMYEKDNPDDRVNVDVLKSDIRKFLMKAEEVRPVIEILITEQTSGLALTSADDVIVQLGKQIHIKESLPGRIPKRFYVEVIRNFFLGMIDCWYEGEIKSLDEGITVMMRIMSLNQLNTFRYMRKTKFEKTV